MKKTIMTAMALAVVLVVSPALAEETTKPSPSVFSRELINKVDHSLIAHWAMAAGDGLQRPGWICSGVIFQSLPEENAAYVQ